MDPISITTGCLSLVGTIGKVTLTISSFVRKVREARSDLDNVRRELVSLNTVLELLAEDADHQSSAFPATLSKHITSIVVNCNKVVLDIQSCLDKYESASTTGSMKWALSGRDEIEKLRYSLEAHKSALEIGLEMLTM
jgi:hypothetical protein